MYIYKSRDKKLVEVSDKSQTYIYKLRFSFVNDSKMSIKLLVLLAGAVLVISSALACDLDNAGYMRCTRDNKLKSVHLFHEPNYLSSKLEIKDEKLSSILPNAFNDFGGDLGSVRLLHLRFADNKILDLQPQSFNGLPNLQALIISSGIVPLEQNLFTSVSKTLTTLSLSINGTNPKLSNGLSILTNLNELTIENTILNSIDNKTFENLSTKIIRLELSNNSLAVIKQNAFSPLKNLKMLVIDNNKLSIIDADTFASLTVLISLVITNNNLNTIRGNPFVNMKYISFINFDNNNISVIENGTFLNLVLDKLLLRNNRLSIIEEHHFKRLTVKELNLAGNCELNFINNSFFIDTRVQKLILPKQAKRCCEKDAVLFLGDKVTFV